MLGGMHSSIEQPLCGNLTHMMKDIPMILHNALPILYGMNWLLQEIPNTTDTSLWSWVIVFLVGLGLGLAGGIALYNFWIRSRANRILRTKNPAVDEFLKKMHALNETDFKGHVADVLRKDTGWRNVHATSDKESDGVDVTGMLGEKSYVIRCLRVGNTVDTDMVRSLVVTQKDNGAAGALLITTGRFDSRGQAIAQKYHIDLWDGTKLAYQSMGTQPKTTKAAEKPVSASSKEKPTEQKESKESAVGSKDKS